MKLEYLAIIPSESSFCENKIALKNLIQSDANIKITERKIKHGKFEADYELFDGKNVEKKHRFYHIRLISDASQVEELSKLGRAIRKMLNIASEENVQTLWDDVSFHYAQKSYPEIHEIENLMRKLITKFMLTNVGIGWAKETIPYEIRKSARLEASEASSNYLYEVDFIQLSDFLFNEYSTSDINSFIKKLTDTKEETINLKEISEYIPKSNWKRYFETHVDCDATYLQSRWKKLYELRCKIAHNNTFTKNDYEQTEKTAAEVKEKLNKAVSSLDSISVPEREREELAEIVISQTGSTASLLISKIRDLNKVTYNIYTALESKESPGEIHITSTNNMLRKLIDAGIITPEQAEEFKTYKSLRNNLIHVRSNFPEDFLLDKLDAVTALIEYVSFSYAVKIQIDSFNENLSKDNNKDE